MRYATKLKPSYRKSSDLDQCGNPRPLLEQDGAYSLKFLGILLVLDDLLVGVG